MKNETMKMVLMLVFLSQFGTGCTGTGTDEPLTNPQTVAEDILFAGAPDNADLVDEKTDQIIPRQFFELVDQQSPVKSQGARGTCVVFAVAALMEHLFTVEGTHTGLDLSEQFLHWLCKQKNPVPGDEVAVWEAMKAATHVGTIEERYWRYQSHNWTSQDDPACLGEQQSRPVRCFTNGEPPQQAIAARKYATRLPRWISVNPDSLKAYMIEKHLALQAAATIYNQAWSLSRSELPIDREYWNQGTIFYPNDEDKRVGRAGGHAFLLVGWDDDMEIQRLDANGQPLFDPSGQPVVDKGFFLFKNSWGTNSHGRNNPKGAGYGWISYQYLKEFGRSLAMDSLPSPEPPEEARCGDGSDDDYDGTIDCADPGCARRLQCHGEYNLYEDTRQQDVWPWNDWDEEGFITTLEIPAEAGEIKAMAVEVDLSFPGISDVSVLEMYLQNPAGEEHTIFHLEHDGGQGPSLEELVFVDQFNGQNAAGTWQFIIAPFDGQEYLDPGRLARWGIRVYTGEISQAQGGLLLTEYLEGSGNNKALEITNQGDTAHLGDCQIRLYRNGSLEPLSVPLLPGDLNPGASHVLCHNMTDQIPISSCDQQSPDLTFNGDDALALVCQNRILDVFGRIGEDPGSAWGSGDTSTKNRVLRRNCTVQAGDANGSDSFLPSMEWAGFDMTRLEDLGRHCP